MRQCGRRRRAPSRKRERVVVQAEIEHLRTCRGRGRRRADHRRSRPALRDPRVAPAPSCRRWSRARRNGRAGRGRDCRTGSPAGAAAAQATRATARRPRTGRARPAIAPRGRAAPSSVVAIPPAILAPAWLCTAAMPAWRGSRRPWWRWWSCRWSPRSSTLPGARRAPSAPMASGSRRIRTLPGALVAPPPRRRESAPTARASASLASVPHSSVCGLRGVRPRAGEGDGEGRVPAARRDEHPRRPRVARGRAAAALPEGRRRRTR